MPVTVRQPEVTAGELVEERAAQISHFFAGDCTELPAIDKNVSEKWDGLASHTRSTTHVEKLLKVLPGHGPQRCQVTGEFIGMKTFPHGSLESWKLSSKLGSELWPPLFLTSRR